VAIITVTPSQSSFQVFKARSRENILVIKTTSIENLIKDMKNL